LVRFVLTLLLSSVLVGTAFAAGEAPAPTAHANLQLTLTVGRTGGPSGPTSKIYKLLGQEGSITRMLMGWKTPIPTRSAGGENGAPAATSFVYQNVGVTADFETVALTDGRFFVSGQVEISGAREEQAGHASDGKPPLIGTFQQSLKVVLADGKKLRIAEGPDPDQGVLYVDLQVDLLK